MSKKKDSTIRVGDLVCIVTLNSQKLYCMIIERKVVGAVVGNTLLYPSGMMSAGELHVVSTLHLTQL